MDSESKVSRRSEIKIDPANLRARGEKWVVTKFGSVKLEDGELGPIDRDEFLKFTKEYKASHETFPENDADWILLYKKTLAAEHAGRYFDLVERSGL